MLRVSIALCTCDGAEFLQTQLDSLASQSRLPDEVIVNDDASGDETVAILDRFAATARFPVRVERNRERLGIHGNFGRAIERCTGDVILPCDQDDFWLPEKIARQVEPFERDLAVTYSIVQSEIVDERLLPRGGKTVFDEQRFDAKLRHQVASGEGLSAFLRHNVAPGHAAAFSEMLRKVLLPFPTTCVYDQWVSLLASAVGRTALINEPLVRYRAHVKQSVGREKTLVQWAAFKPKLDHLQRQIDTLAELEGRIAGLSQVAAERKSLIADRKRFLLARQSMKSSRLRRTFVAFRLLADGSYHRQGRGWLSFGRDLRGRG